MACATETGISLTGLTRVTEFIVLFSNKKAKRSKAEKMLSVDFNFSKMKH